MVAAVRGEEVPEEPEERKGGVTPPLSYFLAVLFSTLSGIIIFILILVGLTLYPEEKWVGILTFLGLVLLGSEARPRIEIGPDHTLEDLRRGQRETRRFYMTLLFGAPGLVLFMLWLNS